jgi:RNA-directed DNA polymerase
VNTDASWPSPDQAESRVLGIQTKLHQWATGDPNRRFDDLYNLVCDPAFLVVAWERVRRNKGARSAGVDGVAPRAIAAGKEMLLNGVRADLKARRFSPLPVRERLIPKKGGKLRGLGIPTARDRTVQAALKLVLEPIFEADFQPCSYGFRPGRRAQDAIAEIHFFASRSYEWVLEGDITACFDEISHVGIMDRLRRRIADKRVLALVKAFLKVGILTEDGAVRDTITGTPQGAILSPLLSNLALSVLDEYFTEADGANGSTESARRRRRRHGLANCRLVRFADDFVVLVAGSRAHTEDLREKVAAALQPMGLRLSEQKTKIAHIDEGFDFLGFRIQRHKKRGTGKQILYTYPSKAALAAIKAKVRTLTRRDTTNQTLADLLRRVNAALRGWTSYFRYGVSKATFNYLRAFAWRRVVRWLRRKHPRATWRSLQRRYLSGWWPTQGEVTLFNPGAVVVSRYRYRGDRIPSPWAERTKEPTGSPAA